MWRYSIFILSILIKKKGIYLCFVILCLTFTGLFYPNINQSNGTLTQGLYPISTFTKWFPFVFSSIFSSLIIIRLFKTGEKDGTELLISAKPIKRWKIIISKFFILFLMIILFHFFLFIFYIGITQIDKYATQKEKINFSISMVIGGIIVSLIMSSLIVIISAVVGKVGTSIIGIIFSAAIPILSFAIVPVSKAISPSDNISINNKKVPILFLNEKSSSSDSESIYEKPISIFYWYDKSSIIDNKNSWYNYAKYFDFWYQLGRFYSLVGESSEIKRNIFSYNTAQVSYKEIKKNEFTKIINNARKMSLKLYLNNATKYAEHVGVFSKEEIEYEKNEFYDIYKSIIYNEFIKKGGNLPVLIKNITEKNIDISNKITNESNINLENDFSENKKNNYYLPIIKILSDNKLIKDENMNYKYIRILIWRMIVEYQSNNPITPSSSFDDKNNFNSKIDRGLGTLLLNDILNSSKKLSYNIHHYLDDETKNFSYEKFSEGYFPVKDYEEQHYLKTGSIVIFWGIICMIFISSAILIYLRKDFK